MSAQMYMCVCLHVYVHLCAYTRASKEAQSFKEGRQMILWGDLEVSAISDPFQSLTQRMVIS